MSKLSPYIVVYVDDEAMSLKYFEKGFSQDFNVMTASSAAEGWDIIQKHQGKVGVLMSDQRMPGQTGVQLFEKARHHFPQIVRILVTAYSDIESAVAGVNAGAIYQYVNKPWEVIDLRITLLRALEFYGVLRERDQLLREKLSVLHQIVLCDRTKNLAVLASGLSSHFRYALQAAQAFIAAIPHAPLEPAVEESLRGEMGKNIESHLRRAGQDIFYVADALKKLAESSSSPPATPLPLETLLSPVTQLNSSHPSKPVSLKISATLPKIAANQSQLTKMFAFLASNVAALAEDNRPITIEATGTTGRNGVPIVQMNVADEGPDWNLGQRIRFFSPFASFEHGRENFGLDLAICYFIAHHHGGRIAIPGQQKARVTVELPIDPLASGPDVLDSSQLAGLFRHELGFA